MTGEHETHVGGDQSGVEQQLDQAESKTWQEVPQWLKHDVSPLVRFIVDEQLQKDLAGKTSLAELGGSPDDEPVTPEKLQLYILEVERIIDDQIRKQETDPPENAYHNAEHASQVVARTAALLLESNELVSAERARSLVLAAAFHDMDHTGLATYKWENGLSNEQHAAQRMLEYARKKGMNVQQQVEMYTAIIGTSFWDSNIQPQSFGEQLVQLADLGGYMEENYSGTELDEENIDDWTPRMRSFAEWMLQSVRLAEEVAKLESRSTMDWVDDITLDDDGVMQDWLIGQTGFIRFKLNLAHQHFRTSHTDTASEWIGDQRLMEKWQLVHRLRRNAEANLSLDDDAPPQDVRIELTQQEEIQLQSIIEKVVMPKLKSLREQYSQDASI